MKPLERIFERALWESRLLVVVAVITSVLVGIGVMYITTIDVVDLLGQVLRYANSGLSMEARNALRTDLVGLVVVIIDGYLLAVALLIFALGLYELFVSKIDIAEGSAFASRLLLIRSFDDLKDRLAKIVLLMLVVKFFQQALELKYTMPLELLELAFGILLVAVALYLTHRGHGEETE